MTKEQWSKVLAAVLICLLSVLSAFGYDVGVVQPRVAGDLAASQATVTAATATSARALGPYYESLTVGKVLDVKGPATFADGLTVTGSVTATRWVTGTSNLALTGALTVTGATKLNGGLAMDTNKFVVSDTSGNFMSAGTGEIKGASKLASAVVTGTLTATGATALNGGLTMDTSKFTVADTSGDTSVGGTLAVAGASTLHTTTVDGNALITGTLTVDGNTTFGGLDIASATLITPTAGQTVTPAYELYKIGSAADVSMTLAACSHDGQKLLVEGKSAHTVTINDSNVRTSTGNAVTLGQYDVSGWLCVGTEWIETFLLADS